jgi:hypothetical protein
VNSHTCVASFAQSIDYSSIANYIRLMPSPYHLVKQSYCLFNLALNAEPIIEGIESDSIRLHTQFDRLTQDRDSKMNMVEATKAVNQYIYRINIVGNSKQIHLIAQVDNSGILFFLAMEPKNLPHSTKEGLGFMWIMR